ncbi:MAG TPA: VOC family protein [Amycolatopsis sp.]|nr:VOC family protein [Amycolatopsis sp.]
MGAVPKFGVVALDCPDPVALAEFYRELLDWGPAKVDDGWVSLPNPGGGAGLAFQRVPDYRAPDCPSTDNPQQLHLDLYVDVDDMDAAHERALRIGATLLDDKPETWRVYADPAGHPFCLCAC